jgi:hypothetical protein
MGAKSAVPFRASESLGVTTLTEKDTSVTGVTLAGKQPLLWGA